MLRFYAAFELRSGIEARMREYLEVWDHISKKKKKGWRIADMGRSLEQAFKTGDKVVRWAVHEKASDDLILCFYYTPVSSALKKAGKELGSLLHSMKVYRELKDPFWLKLQNRLEDIYSQLNTANKGGLLGPPLVKLGTSKVDMKLELPHSSDA